MVKRFAAVLPHRLGFQFDPHKINIIIATMSEEAVNAKVGASSAEQSGDLTVSTKPVEDNPSDAQVLFMRHSFVCCGQLCQPF